MSARPRVAVTLTQCWHRVPGGSATSILRLTHALLGSGAVDLVGVGPRGDARSPRSLRADRPPPAPWDPPIPVHRVPLPLPVLYDSWTRTGRPSIEAATGPVDVVHLTIPMTIPAGDAPVVATVHDLFPLTDPDRMTGRGARLTAAGLEWIRANARAVMVPSRTVAEECVAHGFAADRLRVVPWGAQVRIPGGARVDEARSRLGIVGPYILFAGTHEPRKNVVSLLRAVTRLGRADLTLVLAGPDGWGGSLADDLSAVPGPVVRTGFLAERDLASLQRGAAAFCFPSLAEGFGLPVLEAMAAGAAVVTSTGTATEEVAGDGALLVEPHDVDALAAALARVLDEPDLATALRERGVRRAAGFTWERAAELTLETYAEVLG